MNENISKQVISRVITKLSGIKPFIEIHDFDNNNNQKSFQCYFNDTNIIYNCNLISVSLQSIEYDLDSYNLVTYLLDNLILSLTDSVKTKNYYFIYETMEEDIIKVFKKNENVQWYVTHDTHLEILSEIDRFEKLNDWTDLKINDKKINTIQSSFPKSVIFGSQYPIIINSKELKTNGDILEIPYYYTDDFYAIRLITDERKKKVILRDKKIKKLHIR